MEWDVILHDAFIPEAAALSAEVRTQLSAGMKMLALHGPQLGRPHVDTLKGSRFANMKELRFRAGDGVWRVAFAFDPARQAVLLIGGDKAGVAGGRFYGRLVEVADRRFTDHLARLPKPKER